MPFNLKRLLQGSTPDRYDPNREAMFAQLLSQGMGPSNSAGSTIGNLARMFAGTRGMANQGRARQNEQEELQRQQESQQEAQRASLAQVMSGLGVNAEPGAAQTLAQNPALLGEMFSQNRVARDASTKAAADAEKATKDAALNEQKAQFITTGAARLGIELNPEEAQAFAANPSMLKEVIERAKPKTPGERKVIKGADGYNYYADTQDRVLKGVVRKEPGPQNVINVGAKAPPGFRYKSDDPNTLEPIPGGPATKITETQGRALEASSRVGKGLEILQAPAQSGEPLFKVLSGLQENVASKVPGGNYLLSPDYQRAQQSMNDIAAALLRMETGAAAPESERLEVVARYSPQPGDSDAVIAQKLQALKGRYETAQQALGPLRGQVGTAATPSNPADFSSMSNEDLLRALGQ